VLIPRILTVLVVLPLFLAALFGLPQSIWGGVVLAIVVLACLEWGRLISLPTSGRLAFTAVVVLVCVGLAVSEHRIAALGLLVLAAGFWTLAVPAWLRGGRPASMPALAAAGILVLCSAWYALFDLQQSAARLLALMGVVWIADTAAYFAGRRFGRTKLAPSISPGKTWEGVAGAALGVGVYYGLLWLVWSPPFLTATRWLDLAIVAGMLVLSIEGDLFESWVKRRAGVKDSGTLLPGHGGVLDRIDGVVAALPFAALLTLLGRG
jgi:phosphatidate cytidylyltransferase